MVMRIAFEVNAQDIAAFEHALERIGRAVHGARENDPVEVASYAMDHLLLAKAPRYAHERMLQVQRLIRMRKDQA